MADILNPGYWRDRLVLHAVQGDEPWRAVWDVPWEEFARAAEAHRAVLAKLVGPADSVVDVGCGFGRLLDVLPKDWHGEYLGVDLSPHMVGRARKAFPGREFLVADLTTCGLPKRVGWERDERWDWAVLCGFESLLVEHLGYPAWRDVERKVKAAARNLLVLDFTHGWRAECWDDPFEPWGYEGRVTLVNVSKSAKRRITVEIERGELTGEQITEAVGYSLELNAQETGPSTAWKLESQEVRHGREAWMPRAASEPNKETP